MVILQRHDKRNFSFHNNWSSNCGCNHCNSTGTILHFWK
jgi:hypothetical protein